jgi:flagellar biosynthesis protein FlhG
MNIVSNTPFSLSIVSGKGGVGKTNLALNLGLALCNAKHPALLVDCDLGLANLDVLLGLTPEHTLQDMLAGTVSIYEVTTSIKPNGFDLLPAASGVPELVEFNPETHRRLLAAMNPLLTRYAFLLLDVGAGITPTVQAFAAMTHIRIMVITPEPTSLTDSYALMKVLNARFGLINFHVLVNHAQSRKEEETTFKRLAGACKHFLNLEPIFLGGVLFDPQLPESVRMQKPLLDHAPGSRAAKDILAVAQTLIRLREKLLPNLADRSPLELRIPDAPIEK